VIHRASGLVYEKLAKDLNVAIDTKKQTPHTTNEESRRNWRVSFASLSTFETHPETHRSTIFVKLESNKAVDEQTPVQGADGSSIHRGEPLIRQSQRGAG
jgi:hypothetical protein